MTKKGLNQILSFLAILLVYTAGNTVLQSQGSEVFFSFPNLTNTNRYGSTIYGMIIVLPLSLLFFYLVRSYSKIYGGQHWHLRVPPLFGFQIIPFTPLGKKYQAFTIFVAFVFPFIFMSHNIRKFFKGGVFRNEGCDIPDSESCFEVTRDVVGHLTTFVPFDMTWSNNYIYGHKESMIVKNGLTFFPGYESWFFLALYILYCWFLAKTIITVMNPKWIKVVFRQKKAS